MLGVMVKNGPKILNVILIIAVGVFIYFLLQKPEPVIKYVPITLEIPIPEKISTFPPVELPKPKKVKPRPTPRNFINADSITKDSLYRDAITEREYTEVFEDSITKSTIKSKVQGKLLYQSLETVVKADTIKVDTVVKVELPKPRIKVYLGAQIGTDIDFTQPKPTVYGNILIQNRKDNIISISADPINKNVLVGYNIKLKLRKNKS